MVEEEVAWIRFDNVVRDESGKLLSFKASWCGRTTWPCYISHELEEEFQAQGVLAMLPWKLRRAGANATYSTYYRED